MRGFVFDMGQVSPARSMQRRCSAAISVAFSRRRVVVDKQKVAVSFVLVAFLLMMEGARCGAAHTTRSVNADVADSF